jgi:type I site-specific restriction-modification system R (restriction) subunit
VKASSPQGNERVGVIWHTQSSGKSLTMAFFVGKIIRLPTLANPTLVVLTDRNELLSDRRNIVVIADKAHRSQYAFIDGFARHLHDALPKASLPPPAAGARSSRTT